MSSVKQNKKPSHSETWWQSLEALARTPRFRAFLEAEFPESFDFQGLSRRRWFQVMGASLALAGLGGCRWEKQEILPFVERPVGRTPGKQKRFATAMPRGEGALGLEVTTVDGRPIKIEGNPRHPASLGATDAVAQAALLELYDPDRAQAVLQRDGSKEGPSKRESWSAFESTCQSELARLRKNQGAGFCVLAESDSSPTLARLRDGLQRELPEMRWFTFDPAGDDHQRAGSLLAFDQVVWPHESWESARVVLCLDADPLGFAADSVRHARHFADGRQPEAGWMNRLYAVESGYSLTGAAADHRLALQSSQIAAFAGSLERLLGGDSVAKPPGSAGAFLEAVAEDLLAHRGQSLVCVGRTQPPEVHAAVHRINAQLDNVGKTIRYTRVADPERPTCVKAIRGLVDRMRAGRVETLLVLGGNPVYNAPADLAFAEALRKVPTSIHLSTYDDETSRRCTWRLPRAHFLESWGDVLAHDGTYSVVQPMIAPLRDGRSSIEILATLLSLARQKESSKPTPPQDLVRETFRGRGGDEKAWQNTLRDGLWAKSRWPEEKMPKPGGPALQAAWAEGEREGEETLEIVFRPDSLLGDGRWANNSWLQELPEPMTKLTWDNAARIAPETAARLGVENETLVTIALGGQEIHIPAYIMPGQAPGSIELALGYGRTAAGSVGGDVQQEIESVGVDVYPLRTTAAMTLATGATLRPTSEAYPLASTQDHFAIDAIGRKGRQQRLGDLIRQATLDDYQKDPHFLHHDEHHPPLKSLWKEFEYEGRRWGMAIDLSRCIGCGACVAACQAENNIPVVGKQQVLLGREMHWLRVDRYFRGPPDSPEAACQPLPCQQCELAPCEQVCPVAATVHSHEGLNDMVYNRCVGTRYCANNCPYKVRRFNYFNLHKDLEDPANEIAKMKYNPQVTVRSRGVMEKCTYCVQRIQEAKIEARRTNRPIADGRIQPACAQVCPAGAIVFGDLADADSAVRKQRESDRAYALLAGLNVKPRTVYLARIRNPNPKLASS